MIDLTWRLRMFSIVFEKVLPKNVGNNDQKKPVYLLFLLFQYVLKSTFLLGRNRHFFLLQGLQAVLLLTICSLCTVVLVFNVCVLNDGVRSVLTFEIR